MDTRLNRRQWLKRTAGLVGGSALLGASGLSGQSRVLPRHPDAKLINLAGNENPFGPSQKVVLRLMRELSNSCRYPFREEVVLTEMLAEHEGVAKECIVLGNGCDEILSLAGERYGGPRANIVASRPTYQQLMQYAEKSGAQTRWIDCTENMHHDLAAMAGAIDTDTSLVYLCNPDTPTGTKLPAADIAAFCREVTAKCPVFIDEVYLEFSPEFSAETQVELVRQELPIVIGRSFSKMHALAGHRIGYAVTTPQIAQQLTELKMSSLNYLGVIAAMESLWDSEFHQFSLSSIRKERQRFTALLDELGLPYTPSHGNFVFHYTGIPIRDYQEEMKARGFFVGRPFAPFEAWCRTSIGTPDEMAALASAMRAVFGAS